LVLRVNGEACIELSNHFDIGNFMGTARYPEFFSDLQNPSAEIIVAPHINAGKKE
jgi:hypothetical protein